jgi:hypothetical protein
MKDARKKDLHDGSASGKIAVGIPATGTGQEM